MGKDTRPYSAGVGLAVHIGVNRVDEAVYGDLLPVLGSAESDARAMRDFAGGMGCSSRLVLSEDATREAVTVALEATIERLVDGDFLLVSYSGHMTTLRGVGDDVDGWDEAWCLYDGILLDDEFHDLLAEVPAGCDVLVVTDSCFAGGAVDGPPAFPLHGVVPSAVTRRLPTGRPTAEDVLRRAGVLGPPVREPAAAPVAGPPPEHRPSPLPPGKVAPTPVPPELSPLLPPGEGREKLAVRAPVTRFGDEAIARLVRSGAIPRGRAIPASERRPIVAPVVAIAAAREDRLAFEGPDHGLFTAALLEVDDWLGDETVSYGELIEILAELLPWQGPTLGIFGDATPADVAGPALLESPLPPNFRKTS